MTVGKWRKRYRDLGLEGLNDELRPGRPRTYEDETVAEVINRALQTKPTGPPPVLRTGQQGSSHDLQTVHQ
ncbi:helix-turn-helix domain-containing protein [Cyanobium sp. Cruz-8D1]|nr:helix-turn-helix domain-containing protein [Cyanobium sp. Cruz-8H5]MCP9868338.1 helix-turn-helix domain-containing protein [Cyanobium sp. Cruz-8D1]